MSFILALIAIASGALITYFYDEDAPLFARLCAGTCTGFAALALVGFISASLLGLTFASLLLTGFIVAAPLALLARNDWRTRVRYDFREAWRAWRDALLTRPDSVAIVELVFFVLVAALLWFVFERAMFERSGEIYTGVDNNLGDLPFHLSIITSFAGGDNFPPVHPEFAGARLTYPFLVDFLTAMFVRAGAALGGAFFWENFALAISLVGLLHRFALKLTRDRMAALIAPMLTLLSGGLGWWIFIREWHMGTHGLTELLGALPHDYTITSSGGYRWGNAITTLLVPQRGLLLGLPLALVVITQWWLATGREEEKEQTADFGGRTKIAAKKLKKGRRNGAAERASLTSSAPKISFPYLPFSLNERRMIGAGLIAGLLPLSHAHSFVVMMLVGGCLALLFPRWREWAIFFAVALIIAAPQMWWATRGSAAQASSFFAWQWGWDRGEQNVFWFWFKNTGLFIPLLIAAVAWRGRDPIVSKRLLLFYLPFTLCFLISNAAKISPWVWDNIKVIFYWYIASVPLVALLLTRLWRRSLVLRTVAVALILSLTLAGGLDVWRVVSGAEEQREFDRDGVAFAALVERETPPRSLILCAPTYNHPVYLSGRRSLMGYAGHLWSQGISYATREAELRRIYAGAPDADALLAKYGVDYVVISPLERSSAQPVNEQFFSRFTKVGETGAYHLYKVARR